MSSAALTITSLLATWLLALGGLTCLRHLTRRAGTYLPQMAGCGFAALVANGGVLALLLAGREHRWGWVLLALLLGGSVWYVLFQVVNVVVCSIRARMLMELLDSPDGRAALGDLEARLGPDDAVSRRITRLEQWRELRREGDRCYLSGRRFLILNAILDAWRAILGLPRSEPPTGPLPR